MSLISFPEKFAVWQQVKDTLVISEESCHEVIHLLFAKKVHSLLFIMSMIPFSKRYSHQRIANIGVPFAHNILYLHFAILNTAVMCHHL